MFPPFKTDDKRYPVPVQAVKIPESVYPTNSWFQNGITNTIPDKNRHANAIPWYWIPDYKDGLFFLGFSETSLFANIAINGNLITQENPGNDISVGLAGNNFSLTRIDDYTVTLTQEGDGRKITAYPMRGSPYATFAFENAPVDINFLVTPTITNFEREGNRYTVTTNYNHTTEISASMVSTPGGYVSETSFYDRHEKLNIPIRATFSSNITLIIDISNISSVSPDVHIIATITVGSSARYEPTNLPSDIQSVEVSSSSGGPQVTITKVSGENSTEVFTVVGNIVPDAFPKVITGRYSVIKTRTWFIFTDAVLHTQGSRVYTDGNYTGLLQLAGVGDNQDRVNELSSLYTQFAGNYMVAGTTGNYQGSNDQRSFDVTWNKVGTGNVLWMVPNHWNLLSLTGAVKNQASTVNNIIYGDLSFYELTGPTLHASLGVRPIPLGPDLSTLSDADKSLLANRVTTESVLLSSRLPVDADPYGFGTAAAALGRILMFAYDLNLMENPNVISALTTLRDALIKWLKGENNVVFHILLDVIWGGVLVPADYLYSIGETTLGAFGNSFYNDHHFHWGYLLSALYALEYIGQGISHIYSERVFALIRDISNPQTNNFAWKTRCMDWYSGHSWATGVASPGGLLVGAVNRNQESSSEAINGYYNSYLMAKVLGDTVLEHAAGVCTWMEILASQQYFQLAAPGTREGLFADVGSLGIIQMLGKSFTLFWGMQPDSFNGRAIGMYGIQSFPFTEITFDLLQTNNPVWVNSLPNVYPSYALTPELVIGLNGNTYTPVLAPNENPPTQEFNVARYGSLWGMVGLKILAASKTAISDTQVNTAYNNAVVKQNTFPNEIVLVRSDSFSNTLYWLLKLGRLSSVYIDDYPIIDCDNRPGSRRFPIVIAHASYDDTQSEYVKINIVVTDPDYTTGCRCHLDTSYSFERMGCLKTTRLTMEANIGEMVIGDPGSTLTQKANALGYPVSDIIDYAAMKLVLARLAFQFGSIDQLRRRYNKSILRGINCTIFRVFLPNLLAINLNKLFIY